MFSSNNPLKGKLNATFRNSGFEVYTWFSVMYKLKTGNFLTKNISGKFKFFKDENINAINSKIYYCRI